MIYVALVGLTLVLVRGTIFTPLQRLPLFRCSQCVGMWVGLAAGGAGISTMNRGCFLDALLVGGAVSVLSLGTDAVLLKLLGDPS